MKRIRPHMLGRSWLHWPQRIGLLLAFLSACVTALVPRPALAACGALDVGACVDAAEYSFYYGIASIGWAIDRTLLQLAYQLDQFRWYLVETAFTAAYQVITNFVSPVYIPVATLWAHFQGGDVDAGLAELEAPAKVMIDDLLWWIAALKRARATAS